MTQYHDVPVPLSAPCFEPLDGEAFAPLTMEALEWLNEHAGTQGKPNLQTGQREGYGCITRYNRDWVIFRFRDERVALMFKLTWGGSR